MKVLVSACIMGENCKYNGKNNKNSAAIHFLKDKEVISICPEVLAGMETPRPCAEIVNGRVHYAKEWITMANKEKRFETIYTQGTSLSIVVDTETGVNYLVHDTGITPLLDKNGTVVITEINK